MKLEEILPRLRASAAWLFGTAWALVLVCMAPGPALGATAASAAPASDSIYHLRVALTDQNGQSFRLEERRGRTMLVSMFYTHCDYACPMIIEALRNTEAKLGEAERVRLGVLMVSLDPDRDTVPVLRQTVEQRGLDGARWTLARAERADVRKLAAVLGIQYRALPGGDFNHSTMLLLVDAEGRIVARTPQLGQADPAFVARVKAVLAQQQP